MNKARLARIAMITPYWFPVRGGITTYVSNLSDELRHTFSLDVHVLAREGNRGDATIVKGEKKEFARLAAAELEKIAPDVVHAHGHWYTLQAALQYKKRHPGTRVVFTLHTEFGRGHWLRRRALSRLLTKSDYLTAVSSDLLGKTIKLLRPRTRTRVTHPGGAIRPAEKTEVSRFMTEAGLEGRGPLIAFLGPLTYEAKSRGVLRLIQAMRMVRDQYPNAMLVVAGDGRYRDALEEFANKESPGGSVFLGAIDDPAVVLTAASVVAHISFQEGLPIAILEAMACGTPVVATSAGGIPEVIRDGENGLLVSGDPQEIATAILRVLGSKELGQKLAATATADASTRFSWKKSAEKYCQVYGVKMRHRVIVTVDLERDYHAPVPSYLGIEKALPKLLELFARHEISAYFFATSDLCAAYSDRLQEIVQRGHGLGCHGEAHDVAFLSRKSYDWQHESIRKATEELEQSTGVRPVGFRAPNFSANGDTIRVLEQLGYRFDSSVLPGRIVRAKGLFKLTDSLVAPRDPYTPDRDNPAVPGKAGLVEFPVTENPKAPGGPIGLGFVNAYGVESTLDAIASSCAHPSIVLIHPWELVDPPSGKVPSWMRRACTQDASKLDKFLALLRTKHEVTTFDKESPVSISA